VRWFSNWEFLRPARISVWVVDAALLPSPNDKVDDTCALRDRSRHPAPFEASPANFSRAVKGLNMRVGLQTRTAYSHKVEFVLSLFFQRLGARFRAVDKGRGEGGRAASVQLIEKAHFKKEMQGNERRFTASRVSFRHPRASGIGFANPGSCRGGSRICELTGLLGVLARRRSTRSDQALVYSDHADTRGIYEGRQSA
jgi:hypothetical protein